ncbi:MAG: RagB/SusD family nutrient uptake outer membrane protein [Proteiniphilum sp.]
MKKYTFLISLLIFVGFIAMTSCGDDFLTASSTEKKLAGEEATEEVILANLASAYQILLFDSYANQNYNSVLLMSDLRSDDIYKGGENPGDQAQLYLLSTFNSNSRETLGGLWSIYFTGLARANNVLMACENVADVSEAKLNQYKAEGHFLRAYYTHLLWKFWGNIPYFEEPLDKSPFMAPQLEADEIYEKIMMDVDFACTDGYLPMKSTEIGRVNRAAALMLKARVVLYQKDSAKYPDITREMAAIIKSGQYDLFEDFEAMWLDENEFCKESIFESNQLPEGKTWGSGWQGYGTNLPAFISPNELKDPANVFKGGWGFGPVRPEAYSIYEAGDTRRDGSITDWTNFEYNTNRFQNTGLFMRKYAAREGYNPPPGDQDLNYANNLRIFRYAETLLNYAELLAIHGQSPVDGITAQECLDKIRYRAFGRAASIAATAENIKLERRREFLGEGMRFWDLVRWGDAVQVLTEVNEEYGATRTFAEWMKHIPIPQSEIDKTKNTDFELKQVGQWN